MKQISTITNYLISRPKFHFGLFLIILTILSLLMLFSYQLNPGQDFFFHLRRFQALIDAQSNNSFPWYIDSEAIVGYGYLSKIFYCDILLVPFALIAQFTSTIVAYKVMIFSMVMTTGILTFFSVKGIYKNSLVAFFSALLYTFSYYHLYDIYRRAAIGEAWAMSFIPLVFWGIYVILKGDYKKWYILALGYTFIVFSHVLTAVLVAIITLIILLVYFKSLIKDTKRILALGYAFITTLFLTAYYLYPMIEQFLSDTFYINNGTMNAQDFTMETYRITWGLFLGVVNPLQTLIPGIGLLLTWAVSLRIFIKEKSPQMRSIDFGIIISLFCIFALTDFFPWSLPPFKWINFIQFPWRLNIFISYFFAVAGGYCFFKLLQFSKSYILGILSLIIFISIILISDGRCFQNETNQRSMNEPANRYTFYHIIGGEYLPTSIESTTWLEDRGNFIHQGDSILDNNVIKKNGITSFTITELGDKALALELPLIYYKGYAANIDGQECEVSESEHGLVEIFPTKVGTVHVEYVGTLIQKISLFVSIISFISLSIYIFVLNKRRKEVNEAN